METYKKIVFFRNKKEIMDEQERFLKLTPKEIQKEISNLRMLKEHWQLFTAGEYPWFIVSVDKFLNGNLSNEFLTLEEYNKIRMKEEQEDEDYRSRYIRDIDLLFNWNNIERAINPFNSFEQFFLLFIDLGVIEGLKSRINNFKLDNGYNEADLDYLKAEYDNKVYWYAYDGGINIRSIPNDPERQIEYIISSMERIYRISDELYEGLDEEKNVCRTILDYIKKYKNNIVEELNKIRNQAGWSEPFISEEEDNYLKYAFGEEYINLEDLMFELDKVTYNERQDDFKPNNNLKNK